MPKRDFLSIQDFQAEELENLLALAARMKVRNNASLPLTGKTLGLIFYNKSLRTRVSFEVAMEQLGGQSVNLSVGLDLWQTEAEEGVAMDGIAAEHVKDAAKVMSRYLDAIAVRRFPQWRSFEQDRADRTLRAYARYADVPVINLESCTEHPCQALGDLLTLREMEGSLRGKPLTLTWTFHPVPLSMAVSNSLLLAATRFGLNVTLAHPEGYPLPDEVLEQGRANAHESGGRLEICHDLPEALEGARFVYADSWASIPHYGTDRDIELRERYRSWCLSEQLMQHTAGAQLLHPLPVRRNVAVTDEVLDGPRSLIYQQAENRLHAQKALLTTLIR
ncbi:MAG: N-acetylornithine carbamoyltransferase [Planctomycetota bacterium]